MVMVMVIIGVRCDGVKVVNCANGDGGDGGG